MASVDTISATCPSNIHWSREMVGNSDTYTISYRKMDREEAVKLKYEFGWHCTCKGFYYRGNCRHLEEVKTGNERCGWSGNIEAVEKELRCPGCLQLCVVLENGVPVIPLCLGDLVSPPPTGVFPFSSRPVGEITRIYNDVQTYTIVGLKIGPYDLVYRVRWSDGVQVGGYLPAGLVHAEQEDIDKTGPMQQEMF